MIDLTDEQTWARVCAGDQAEFGAIWDRHRDRVLNFVTRLGETQADAEDLTAVTFLELWRHRDRLRFVDGSVLPWLLVTARNVQRNAARSRRRYRAMLAKLPPAEAVSQRVEPPDPRVALVADVLARARGTDRDLVLLTAVEGFTVGQAAAAVGLSEPAARMRLSRLRSTIHTATTAAATLEGGAQ